MTMKQLTALARLRLAITKAMNEYKVTPDDVQFLERELESDDVQVWLAVPCVCKPCAKTNALAETTYFVWGRPNNVGAIYCKIHGLTIVGVV